MNVNALIRDWAWRVNDGMPDPKNRNHIQVLEAVLKAHKYPQEFIDGYLKNLTEAEVDSETPVKYKDENGERKEMAFATALRQSDGHPARIEAEKMKDEDPEDTAAASKSMYDKPESGSDAALDMNKADKPKPRMISGKNKSLKKVNTLRTSEFTRDIDPTDVDFSSRNIDHTIEPEFTFPSEIGLNPKFPKRYLKALERMMNTKLVDKVTTKWSHFSDIEGGAGQISAQAGELMTMIGTSMDDEEFEAFISALEEHEKKQIESDPTLKDEGNRIIVKSWMKSARENRKAILDRINDTYGDKAQIVATSWDAKNEVEALGLDSYESNKGFSTDMYVKVKTAEGQEILDEVSLKKSVRVNFLNSGAGKFSTWDKNLPDEINSKVYAKKERVHLVETANSILANEAESDPKLKKAIEETERGKGSRAKSKTILKSIKKKAAEGDKLAIRHLETVQKNHKAFKAAAIKGVLENPKLKSGMLEEIRTEFPLKAVSEGEETMAIGAYSLDPKTMKSIFGTSDYDKIKNKLLAKEGPPPFLGYQAEAGGQVIPLAEIKMREDGVGYGGIIKFEMTLHKEFAKVLAKAHGEVYS